MTRHFQVWAPDARSLSLIVGAERHAMTREVGGHFTAHVPPLPSGTQYWFEFPNGLRRPDPASVWQPHGVHGPSATYDFTRLHWTDAGWQGIALSDYVIYELHVGTFTAEGTFDAIIPKLDYLKQLGITAVELMPVAHFSGDRNWGYDGVYLYAPQNSYGGCAGLQRLVNACHAHGLAVILDVVYNHLGPEGNYLADFGPYFTSAHRTPWGRAINFTEPAVRRFFIDNALYWLTEFHIDALRLDAIDSIFDNGPRHVLTELSEAFHEKAKLLGRTAYVIGESERGKIARATGLYGMDAAWNDHFHHALITLLAGPQPGYMKGYGRIADLARALTEPAGPCVVYIQNHDQVANAFGGRRIARLLTPAQHKLAAAVTLLAPGVPLLFAGQEYGETAPFHFFTSHSDPNLVKATREGRKRDYGAFNHHFEDPQAEETFQRSKLTWNTNPETLELYRNLLALRSHIPPSKLNVSFDEGRRYLCLERGPLLLIANFHDRPQRIPLPAGDWHIAFATDAAATLDSVPPMSAIALLH